MRKYLLFLLLTIPLVLGACSGKDVITPKDSIDTESTEKQDTPPVQNETKGTEPQKNEKESTDVPDFFDIRFDSDMHKIELFYPGGKPVVLESVTSSEPLKSPNGEKAVYISPFGWEEMSDLYIVDLHDGSKKTLISFSPDSKPYDVIWEDNEHVLVIMGYPYGTVTWGGGIYRVNIETGENEPIDTDSGGQITKLLRIEDGVLYYDVLEYIDDNLNEYKEYSGQVTLETE